MVRHNMKIMPFTKDIKRILSLYTPIGELIQEECLYGKVFCPITIDGRYFMDIT
jgi:hypothetical protein